MSKSVYRFWIGSKRDVASFEGLFFELFTGVNALLHLLHTTGMDVKTDDLDVLCKSQCNRKPDVTEANHSKCGVFIQETLV